MTGEKIQFADGTIAFVDYSDGIEGHAIIDGREWRWSFDRQFGPLFLKSNGDQRKCQNPKKEVWEAFQDWFEKTQPKKD